MGCGGNGCSLRRQPFPRERVAPLLLNLVGRRCLTVFHQANFTALVGGFEMSPMRHQSQTNVTKRNHNPSHREISLHFVALLFVYNHVISHPSRGIASWDTPTLLFYHSLASFVFRLPSPMCFSQRILGEKTWLMKSYGSKIGLPSNGRAASNPDPSSTGRPLPASGSFRIKRTWQAT